MDETAKRYAKEIGENIRKFRNKMNLSQQELADRIEKSDKSDRPITRDSIAKYENGSVLPPINNITAIAKTLGVPFVDLLPRELAMLPIEEADKGVGIFEFMADLSGYSWEYNEKTRSVAIHREYIKYIIPAMDVYSISIRTLNFFKSELKDFISEDQ